MTQREILDKLRQIEERLEKIENNQRKRYLPWKAAIPPLTLCQDIVSAFDSGLFGQFDYEMQRLSEFYGIAPMRNYTDPTKVSAKAIACYHSMDRAAYYKEPTAAKDVVLHEFFHHLHAENVVSLNSDEDAEKCADEFAKIILARGRVQK